MKDPFALFYRLCLLLAVALFAVAGIAVQSLPLAAQTITVIIIVLTACGVAVVAIGYCLGSIHNLLNAVLLIIERDHT